jgi:hypothetical protein
MSAFTLRAKLWWPTIGMAVVLAGISALSALHTRDLRRAGRHLGPVGPAHP